MDLALPAGRHLSRCLKLTSLKGPNLHGAKNLDLIIDVGDPAMTNGERAFTPFHKEGLVS
jgi:hypothetical protein